MSAARVIAIVVAFVNVACVSPRGREESAALPRDESVSIVRASIVKRTARDAAAVIRGGVARLVSLIPVDPKRLEKLGPVMAQTVFGERLERNVALALERSLSADDLTALGVALAEPSVATVIAAATDVDPSPAELEHFATDKAAFPPERRAKVQALISVTWSPLFVDKLSRAQVTASARIVAAVLPSGETQKRGELLRLGEGAPPADARALVLAFGYRWRSLDDATLDAAHAYFASAEGKRGTATLVAAVLTAIEAITGDVEARL